MESRLDSQSFSERNLACFTLRINLEHDFLNFFDKIEGINGQVDEVLSKLTENNFNILLFDEEYESNIKRITHFEEEIERTCIKLKEIEVFKEIITLLIDDWTDILFKLLKFNAKNVKQFAKKLAFINQLTFFWDYMKKEINLFALKAEKMNKKKTKKYFIQEDLILKFSDLIEDFRGTITEAKFSKRAIEIQSKQFFIGSFLNIKYTAYFFYFYFFLIYFSLLKISCSCFFYFCFALSCIIILKFSLKIFKLPSK